MCNHKASIKKKTNLISLYELFLLGFVVIGPLRLLTNNHSKHQFSSLHVLPTDSWNCLLELLDTVVASHNTLYLMSAIDEYGR